MKQTPGHFICGSVFNISICCWPACNAHTIINVGIRSVRFTCLEGPEAHHIDFHGAPYRCEEGEERKSCTHVLSQTLTLLCITLQCFAVTATATALSSPASSNVAGRCSPAPRSWAAPIDRFLLTLLLWRVTVQFSVYNQPIYTHAPHRMVVSGCCSSNRKHSAALLSVTSAFASNASTDLIHMIPEPTGSIYKFLLVYRWYFLISST